MRDIVKEGAWTTLPTGSQLRNEAPQVRVTPFQVDSTQLTQSIKGFVAATEKTSEDFYENLYQGTPKDAYVFPYFGNDFRSFTSEYADTLSDISDRGTQSLSQTVNQIGQEIAGFAANITDFLKNVKSLTGDSPTPGTYIETPKFYQFANTDAPLSFSFPLLNTIDSGDAKRNQEFIKEFTRLNKPTRESSVSMTFPHIYKVQLKGLRFIKWAYCDNLSFSMVGQRRLIGSEIVPEAFICNMSFKSLTVEVANFLDQV